MTSKSLRPVVRPALISCSVSRFPSAAASVMSVTSQALPAAYRRTLSADYPVLARYRGGDDDAFCDKGTIDLFRLADGGPHAIGRGNRILDRNDSPGAPSRAARSFDQIDASRVLCDRACPGGSGDSGSGCVAPV